MEWSIITLTKIIRLLIFVQILYRNQRLVNHICLCEYVTAVQSTVTLSEVQSEILEVIHLIVHMGGNGARLAGAIK